MPVIVVDASAVGAILFNEPEGDQIAMSLEGASLRAPALLPFEVANICLTKMRRRRADRDELFAAFQVFGRMAIETVGIDYAETLALAERTRLTVYDAAYLWLAQALDADLITLDRQLRTADRLLSRGA